MGCHSTEGLGGVKRRTEASYMWTGRALRKSTDRALEWMQATVYKLHHTG